MKIALIGYGRMGKLIEKVALGRGHEIVCKIDVDNTEDFDSKEFASADVAIEFTSPSAAYGNYVRAFEHNVKVVSGSTGWMKDHKESVERMCNEEGKTLFWSSNFSLGVAIFSAINNHLAEIMNKYEQYDVTMSETHHIHKLDAPSGTAITLAENILERLDRKDCWVKGTEGGKNEIPVESIREGEVSGIHSVTYESDADKITITHEAKSRIGFALGAVLAAEYTVNHNGLLTMSDLFKF